MKITWFGHSAFKLEYGSISILIDPFFAPATGLTAKDAGKVDVILVTHDHADHVGLTAEIAERTGAIVGCMVGTADALMGAGIPQKQIFNGIGFNIGGSLEYKGISATMVQAFHSSNTGSPAGYIVRAVGAPVLYHAGDTGIFSSMKLFGNLYKIGLALLPMGGIFTMDAFQAANACKLLGCPQVIPMHWGTFPVLAQNTDKFKELLKEHAPSCSCLDMKIGETISL